MDINGLSLKTICEDSLINRKSKQDDYKGLYIYSCDKLEKDLYQMNKYLTGKAPLAQNILFCNQDTSNEEITSFLYRAILCEFHACFIVGGIELLKSEQKTTLLEILNGFYIENHEEMNSCLIFLYTNKSSDIYKSLELVKHRKFLRIDDIESYENEKYEGDNVEIIYSDKSGVGKSYSIEKNIPPKTVYKHFPFGGVISKNETIERLKELNIENNSLLHIDLFDTEQIELMTEFLFSILITKLYGQNENIFYLPKSVKIKVEIPNSFIDFFYKFPILTLFNQKKLLINNLLGLITPDDLISNEQIVSIYLFAYKGNKLNSEDLFFPELSPQTIEEKNKLRRKASKKLHRYNYKEVQKIPDKKCEELILEQIKKTNEMKYPSYFQIKTFINVLGMELKELTKNGFLSTSNLLISTNQEETDTLRNLLIEIFIKTTKYFTQGAFDELLKGQQRTHEMIFGEYNEGQDITNAIEDLSRIKKDKEFSFKNLNSPIIFFHEKNGDNDSGNFSIITKINKNPEYENLLKLNSLYKKKYKSDCLITFKNYQQKDYLAKLKEILNLENPISTNKRMSLKSSKSLNLLSLEEITDNYVFTPDNFTKMIFILMRIKAGIPVIMMGETGCGKTSLIRKLSEIMNNGEKDKMKILNIHAGTTDNEIIKFIQEKVLQEAIRIKVSETTSQIDSYMKNKRLFFEKKLWVFLDEINTCKSMGLISELMCKNSYQGVHLPDNVIFIGACNPYRQAPKGNEKEEIGLDADLAYKEKEKNLNDKEKEEIHKKSLNNKNKLVYTVNPLPHSLLNYVFDFGSLSPEDEEKYIENMVQNNFDRLFSNNKSIKHLSKVRDLTKKMIIKCQKYIREKNDISSVSLREISRFNTFINFFYNHLTYKKNNAENLMETLELEKEYTLYQSLSELDILIYAINLSIYICYYLRLTKKKDRDELLIILNGLLQSPENPFKTNDFLFIINLEKEFIIKNVDIGKGISKNRALLENMFSLFVAINNKVPIFIVGKPGCSKSLSVQLIYKAMKGKASTNSFFKILPKLIMNSYQGSMGSTSKGVQNIFKKAREILKIYQDGKEKENNEEVISMIFFDEMGLAEHSPNNPLKVIHSELEYEEENKIAFVGISNWRLDASKMNRGIFISIPEPEEDDIKNTSITIGKSYNEILAEKNKDFFENLGEIYLSYKSYLKKYHLYDGKEDFHGNRDFYHLVKNISQNMLIKYNKNEDVTDDDLIEFGLKSIERNFAGIQFEEKGKKTSVETVKSFFNEKYKSFEIKKEYDIIERVKENITDLNSRYLLLESKSSISTYLLSSILSELNKEYYFYIGSKFKKDLESEEYILKVLNKVQFYTEKGNILIMENLDSVYPSMYDLFNQNFTVFYNKNYARLALGSTTNIYSYVNNKFRCIINVGENEMSQQESPFLNRFEKQVISFGHLLNKDLINKSNEIINLLNEMTRKKQLFRGVNYNLEKLLINGDEEEIKGIIYTANKKGIEKEKLIDEILSKISLTLPQDILISLQINGFKNKNKNEYKKILEYYNQHEHINLSNFIQKMTNSKNIVYTFSNKLNTIQNISDINNTIYGHITDDNTKIIKLDSLNSELELDRLIDSFITGENNKLCIIKFSPDEGVMMNYIKYFIENKEKEYIIHKNPKNYKKAFIFIMHMVRLFDNELKENEKDFNKTKEIKNKKILKETISNLSGYNQIFIDNLNGNLTLDNILKTQGKEIYNKCLDLNESIIDNIYLSLSYMNYNINSSIGELYKENYVNKLIRYFENNEFLRNLINNCIMKQITGIKGNIIDKIFKIPNIVENNDIDMISVIKKYLSSIYTKNLNLLIFKAEKDSIFSSLLSFDEIDNKKMNSNILHLIFAELINKDKNIKEKEIDEIIRKIIKNNLENYFENLIFNDGSVRINEAIGSNKLNIILGLIIPGVKKILDKIIKKVKDEITNKYYENEINLRCYLNSDEDKENELNEEKQIYFDELNRCNNSTLIDIEKQKFLIMNEKYFNNNPNELNVFYYMLFNDYYTLYINNNLNKSKNDKKGNNNENKEEKKEENNEQEDQEEQEEIKDKFNLENTKRFLKLLVYLKNKYSKWENCTQIQLLANTINWLESYEVEITILLKMFSKLDIIIPDLYYLIEDIIISNKIEYEISERNPEYVSIVNKVFFYGMESILRVITSNISLYTNEEKSEDEMNRFYNTNKEILQDATQLNTILNLHSKAVYTLEEIIELIDAFNMNNIRDKENISLLIYYFNLQNDFIVNNLKDLLSKNLENLYNFIFEKIGKDKNYHKIMNKILFDEFLKIYDEEYRKQILTIILKDKKFIVNSGQILKIIIKNHISSDPSEDLTSNINTLTNKDSPIISLLNNENNTFLDEILLHIFEGEIIHYFDSIPKIQDKETKLKYSKYFKDNTSLIQNRLENKTGIIFNESFEIFKTFIENLESIIKDINNKNLNLSKLYSIAYVKIYLRYLVTFIKNEKLNAKDIKEIIEFISSDNQSRFRNVIKIYILKLFNSLMDSFEEFKNFNFEKYGIQFHKEYSLWNEKLKKKVEDNIINYCFMTIDNEKDKNNFIEQQNNLRTNEEEKIIENIKNNGIDPFICIAINKYISNLGYKEIKNKEEFNSFYKLSNKILNGTEQFNDNLKKLLFLFIDENQFKNKIKKNLIENGNINSKLFETILYSFRFCLQSLEALDIQKRNNNKKKLFFASIFDKQCIKNINEAYIPGNELQEDLHITTHEYVQAHLNSNPDNIGCYVCSCGYYYSIQPCGFPTRGVSSTCPICKSLIGYGAKKVFKGIHALVQRPGHMRIFKDENQKNDCMSRYGDCDENVPNMTYAAYWREYIQPRINKNKIGFNLVTYDWFMKRDKKIRKLNELSYRILNYIMYSHLFFANCLEYISDKDLKEYYLVKDMKCINIIEKDWEFIKELLQKNGIQSIQIFMNLIFKRLSELIKNYEYFTESDSRDNFEEKIEQLVNKCLSEYDNYSTNFIAENKILLELDNYNIKTIINELSPPNEEIYHFNDYPLFKYFILTNYISRDDLINKLGPSKIYVLKYPLLHQYLLDNIDTKKMKYLPAFNEFTNYMVDNYSFKISRDDAKKRELKSEPIFKEPGFQNKFNNFIKAWNEIRSEAIKYKCRDEMKPKELNKDEKLICFLNDDGEWENGMYLAAACQNFITWQNTFLQPIIDNVAQNGILHYFAKNMQRKIPLQSAKINQTLLLEDCFNNSLYYNFEDIISTFSRRDIFKEDETINYFNYNSFIYDFASIEEELGRLLLPGKCLFENEDNLNFVAYWSEGFQGGKSDTLSNFYLKYPQKDLDELEKEKIMEYISKSQKKLNNNDYKQIFGSMQLLIFYLSNNLYKNEDKIINVIKNAPKYLKISSNCYELFEKEGKSFTIEKLMNIFFFIEHLCYNELISTLQPEYKKPITDELKRKIKSKLLNQEMKNEGFTVKQFAAALRRYICRYLAGQRQSVDVGEKRDLTFELSRIDLWEEKIGKLDNLVELLFAYINEFKLNVGQAYELYKLVQDQDLNPMEEMDLKKKLKKFLNV